VSNFRLKTLCFCYKNSCFILGIELNVNLKEISISVHPHAVKVIHFKVGIYSTGIFQFVLFHIVTKMLVLYLTDFMYSIIEYCICNM